MPGKCNCCGYSPVALGALICPRCGKINPHTLIDALFDTPGCQTGCGWLVVIFVALALLGSFSQSKKGPQQPVLPVVTPPSRFSPEVLQSVKEAAEKALKERARWHTPEKRTEKFREVLSREFVPIIERHHLTRGDVLELQSEYKYEIEGMMEAAP